jgi:hypothetical protein
LFGNSDVTKLQKNLANHSRDDGYFKPLMSWLEEQNKGRQIGWKARPLLRIRYGSEDGALTDRRRHKCLFAASKPAGRVPPIVPDVLIRALSASS